jgi:integrase
MARKRTKGGDKASVKAATERLEKIGKLADLAARPGTPHEGKAAAAALERLGARPNEIKFWGPLAKEVAEERKADSRAAAPVATTPRQRPPQEAREPLDNGIAKREAAPESGSRIRYDTMAGFGLRTTSTGVKSWILNYRVKGSGIERRYTIGGFPNWSTTAARAEARRLRKLVDEGGDPLGDIEAKREAPTVAKLCDRFEAEHVVRKRPSTADAYKRMLKLYIRPALGNLKVEDVTFSHIDALHRKISKAGHIYRANRVVAVLSKMFNLAIRWAMRTDNPAKGIERNTEKSRKRYLIGDELKRLTAALAAYPERSTANVVLVLLYTGCRRGEALGMRWADVDLEKGIWSKPASSTKQDTDHVVPLSAEALQLLSEIRAAQTHKKRELGEYVFPSIGKSGHLVELKKGWTSITKTAGITGLRLHDLRHSFASALVSGGASLPLIGALLGHANTSTTARYSHLYLDPQRAAVEQVGALVAASRPKAARRVS